MAGNHSAHQAAAPMELAPSNPAAARPAKTLDPVAPAALASAPPSLTIQVFVLTATRPALAWLPAAAVPTVLQEVFVL